MNLHKNAKKQIYNCIYVKREGHPPIESSRVFSACLFLLNKILSCFSLLELTFLTESVKILLTKQIENSMAAKK